MHCPARCRGESVPPSNVFGLRMKFKMWPSCIDVKNNSTWAHMQKHMALVVLSFTGKFTDIFILLLIHILGNWIWHLGVRDNPLKFGATPKCVQQMPRRGKLSLKPLWQTCSDNHYPRCLITELTSHPQLSLANQHIYNSLALHPSAPSTLLNVSPCPHISRLSMLQRTVLSRSLGSGHMTTVVSSCAILPHKAASTGVNRCRSKMNPPASQCSFSPV